MNHWSCCLHGCSGSLNAASYSGFSDASAAQRHRAAASMMGQTPARPAICQACRRATHSIVIAASPVILCSRTACCRRRNPGWWIAISAIAPIARLAGRRREAEARSAAGKHACWAGMHVRRWPITRLVSCPVWDSGRNRSAACGTHDNATAVFCSGSLLPPGPFAAAAGSPNTARGQVSADSTSSELPGAR